MLRSLLYSERLHRHFVWTVSNLWMSAQAQRCWTRLHERKVLLQAEPARPATTEASAAAASVQLSSQGNLGGVVKPLRRWLQDKVSVVGTGTAGLAAHCSANATGDTWSSKVKHTYAVLEDGIATIVLQSTRPLYFTFYIEPR